MGRNQCNRCNNNCLEDEVVVCNNVFKFNLTEVDANTHTLTVIACNTPTAVYDVGTIKTRENTCTGFKLFKIVLCVILLLEQLKLILLIYNQLIVEMVIPVTAIISLDFSGGPASLAFYP